MTRTSTRDTCAGPERDRKNQWRMTAWSLLWAAAFLAVVYAIVRGWLPAGWPAAAATLVPTVLGAVTALAHLRFLREADELRRKIELDALAIAFGAGVVGGLALWMLGVAWPALDLADVDLALAAAGMLIVYSAASWLGRRRYA
jgi:hypothetical protein